MEANYFTILEWVLSYIDMNQPWIYMYSPSRSPSHLPLHPIPLGLPSAPAQSTCLMHPAWAGDLLHPREYTCFDAVLSKHPTLAFSHIVFLEPSNSWMKPSFNFFHCKMLLQHFFVEYVNTNNSTFKNMTEMKSKSLVHPCPLITHDFSSQER